MAFLQIPVVPFPALDAVIEREIRPGGEMRYEVQSEWTSPNGHATYSYQMRFQFEREAPSKKERGVVARLENLRAVYDETRVEKKLFGVIPFTLGPNGGPTKMSGGGALNTFVLPLIAFSLPGTFTAGAAPTALEPFAIGSIGNVRGVATLNVYRAGAAEVRWSLQIGEGPFAGALEGTSVFDPVNGQLRSAKGTYEEASGKLAFSIRLLG